MSDALPPFDDLTGSFDDLPDDLDALLPAVYGELRRLAHHQLRRERADHTLSTTALVHEAYLRLADVPDLRLESRGRFFALAARVMRHVLVNYAHKHRAQKRGGGERALPLDEALVVGTAQSESLLALDEALQRLHAFSPRQSQVVECRFFGGLSIEETAEALDVSPMTVKREWRVARAWLNQALAD